MISIPLSEKPDNTSFLIKWRAYLIICYNSLKVCSQRWLVESWLTGTSCKDYRYVIGKVKGNTSLLSSILRCI